MPAPHIPSCAHTFQQGVELLQGPHKVHAKRGFRHRWTRPLCSAHPSAAAPLCAFGKDLSYCTRTAETAEETFTPTSSLLISTAAWAVAATAADATAAVSVLHSKEDTTCSTCRKSVVCVCACVCVCECVCVCVCVCVPFVLGVFILGILGRRGGICVHVCLIVWCRNFQVVIKMTSACFGVHCRRANVSSVAEHGASLQNTR